MESRCKVGEVVTVKTVSSRKDYFLPAKAKIISVKMSAYEVLILEGPQKKQTRWCLLSDVIPLPKSERAPDITIKLCPKINTDFFITDAAYCIAESSDGERDSVAVLMETRENYIKSIMKTVHGVLESKYLNAKVCVIWSAKPWVKVGKVYEIVNGWFPSLCPINLCTPITSIDDLNEKCKGLAQFLQIID